MLKAMKTKPSTDENVISTYEGPLQNDSAGCGDKKQAGSPGMTAFEALSMHRDNLSTYEKREILRYDKVYFVGRTSQKHQVMSPTNENGQKRQMLPQFGADRRSSSGDLIPVFDDHENFYRIIKHDHIAYRFEVLSLLGKGSFGQVVMAFDHMKGTQVALKIIRTESRFTRQAREEIKILETLRQMRGNNTNDVDGCEFPIVQLFEHFTFRKHICMTFELLSINLYDLLKLNKFAGLPRDRVRRISFQILKALYYVEKAGIIHCDLKPENVLLIWPPEKYSSQSDDPMRNSTQACSPKNNSPFMEERDCIKLIDFGSSCFKKGPTYPYIQSRFYRAPEVILRTGYAQPIDIWSFGCVVAELINGLPLFPGEDEADQLACIIEILGTPPDELLQKSPHVDRFFIEHRTNKPKNAELQFVDHLKSGPNREGGTVYLPRYCSIRYPEGGGSPELGPGIAKRSGQVRGTPGSMSLLTAILQPRHRRFRRKDTQSMANLATGTSAVSISPEEEALLSKDNELLLSLMLSCLTWSPSERIKPYKAIQHMWLRNFTRKSRHDSSSGIRTHSMEVSRLAPTKSKETSTDNQQASSSKNQLPIIIPRRRNRLSKQNSDSLSSCPIKLYGDQQATPAEGTALKSEDKEDTKASQSPSPRRHSKVDTSPHPNRLHNGGFSVNAVSISPTNGANGTITKPMVNSGNNTNGLNLTQATVTHNSQSVSKRVTLVYPTNTSCSEIRSGDKTISVDMSAENSAGSGDRCKLHSFLLASNAPAQMNAADSHALSSDFRGNQSITTTTANNNNRAKTMSKGNPVTRAARVSFVNTNNRPFSDYYSIHKAEVNGSINPDMNSSDEKKLSNSVPRVSAMLKKDSAQHSPQVVYADHGGSLYTLPQYTANKEGVAQMDQTISIGTNNIPNTNNKVGTNHVIITKAVEPQSINAPAKLIQLIRPTNQSSKNPSHSLNSNEPRMIRITNTRHGNNLVHIPEEYNQIEEYNPHPYSRHQTRAEVGNYEDESWNAHQSPTTFKTQSRVVEQMAPEVAPKPSRDILLLNPGRYIRADGLATNTTSVWAPQPYYQHVPSTINASQPNSVVYRRISGLSYHRGPTIEIRPYSHYQEY
ncbi:hypothetical protein P879_03082 [Paragonimus westermani]|uniref:dual-specificity kinase n=1 Tax=Paragonimus westermani TaxID=34504 RepID=A0A8T0DPK2_9TREM|nr:hypothetical protein P879_03082 [Paragonimus westermani]